MADIAGHVHIRQEVHFNSDKAITLAGLTSATLHVKREAACVIATFAGSGRLCEELADWRKEARISGGIASRCSSNWALVHTDDLIEELQALNGLHARGLEMGTIDFFRCRGHERIVDEG